MSEAQHTAEHSPLPWSAHGPVVTNANGLRIAQTHFSDCGEDAALIVTAVNAHADLLAACARAEGFVKYALEFWDWSKFPNLQQGTEDLLKRLQAAIAKATGAK